MELEISDNLTQNLSISKKKSTFAPKAKLESRAQRTSVLVFELHTTYRSFTLLTFTPYAHRYKRRKH